MMVEENVSLKEKTTFKMGGVAQKFYTPESTAELTQLIRSLRERGEPFRILSGGSNLLIDDAAVFPNVISMRSADTTLTCLDEAACTFYVGASVRIQQAIRFANSHDAGGIEELFPLPALFGGIVYMNAGIGNIQKPKFSISQYILSVSAYNVRTGEVEEIAQRDCGFAYRTSVFQRDDYVILGATLQLKPQDPAVSASIIQDTLARRKAKNFLPIGSFGSCYCVSSRKILNVVRRLPLHKHVQQDPKNANWFHHDGQGTFKETRRIIRTVDRLHKLLGKKCKLEIIIWE